MIKHQKRTEKNTEKKYPSAKELRERTWSSVEQIVTLLMKSMFELLLEHTALGQVGALRYERSGSRSN